MNLLQIRTLVRFGSTAALAVLVLGAHSAFAGTITNITPLPGIASIAAEPIAVPVAPNNDNVPGISPNPIVVQQKAYTAVGPVDILFDVTDSGGVTEYRVTEGVFNGTGINWTGYRLELGFGSGGGFVPSPSGDGLDFDAPDFDSPVDFPGFFTTIVALEDSITASDGIFMNGAFADPPFLFSIDVPDGISQFTLRQIPIVIPEPSTAMLLLGGLVALGSPRGSRTRLEHA